VTPDALREALRRIAFPSEGAPVARRLAATIAERADGVRAVIFFGSRKSGAGANEASAYDVFLAVDDYAPFYRSLAQAGWVSRPRVAALLNRWLPPNVVSLAPSLDGHPVLAKCAVLTFERLCRETSPRRHDHFCIGRLFQPVEVVWTRDAETAEDVLSVLESAVRETASWIHSSTPQAFTAEGYVHALLRVSLAGEIRPEPASRAGRLLEAQRDSVVPLYGVLLRELESRGIVKGSGEQEWCWVQPTGRWEAVGTRGYFLRSKIRATLRWSKYMITFEGWLDYLLRKVARHTGEEIVLTDRERRFPLIFLWPRFFRYLREKEERVSR
jgi:hypothetical protein